MPSQKSISSCDRENSDMDGDALVDVAAWINNREEFIQFLSELSANLGSHSDEWENGSLELFLGAMKRFTERADGYYQNIGEAVNCEQPSWRLFAEFCWPRRSMSRALLQTTCAKAIGNPAAAGGRRSLCRMHRRANGCCRSDRVSTPGGT